MANEEKLYCTVCLKYHMVLRVQKSAPVFVHVYSVYNGKVPRKDLDFPTAQSISKEGSNFLPQLSWYLFYFISFSKKLLPLWQLLPPAVKARSCPSTVIKYTCLVSASPPLHHNNLSLWRVWLLFRAAEVWTWSERFCRCSAEKNSRAF